MLRSNLALFHRGDFVTLVPPATAPDIPWLIPRGGFWLASSRNLAAQYLAQSRPARDRDEPLIHLGPVSRTKLNQPSENPAPSTRSICTRLWNGATSSRSGSTLNLPRSKPGCTTTSGTLWSESTGTFTAAGQRVRLQRRAGGGTHWQAQPGVRLPEGHKRPVRVPRPPVRAHTPPPYRRHSCRRPQGRSAEVHRGGSAKAL